MVTEKEKKAKLLYMAQFQPEKHATKMAKKEAGFLAKEEERRRDHLRSPPDRTQMTPKEIKICERRIEGGRRLPPGKVRELARRSSFSEFSYHLDTGLVVFRGSDPASGSSASIHVYTEDGMVATCIWSRRRGHEAGASGNRNRNGNRKAHPSGAWAEGATTNGRTLNLFPSVELGGLRALLRNPGIGSQTAFFGEDRCRGAEAFSEPVAWRNGGGSPFSDAAVRWEYVCSATGLSTDRATVDHLAGVCGLWETWRKVGAEEALVGAVLGVASRMFLGYPIVAHHPLDGPFLPGLVHRGEEAAAHATAALEALGNRDARIEAMRWCLGRWRDNYFMTGTAIVFPIQTGFSFAVDAAHTAYGRLAYSDKLLATSGFRPMYGR